MQLNVSYDSSTLGNAPSGFFSAVNYVIGLFDATFTNNVTVNIEIGYGTFPFDGSTVLPLGESVQNNLVFGNYAQTRQALLNEGAPGATTLPATSPLSGGLVLGSAEERALGLIGASSVLDGWVGIASDPTLAQQIGGSWSYSATAVPGSSQYYLVGVLEHEITEVMGRTSYLNVRGEHAVMDLLRYKGSGQRQTGTGSPAYFSTDGGATNLNNWNTNLSGDIGDWASSAGADAFLAFNPAGQIDGLSGTDITLMSAIGWTASAPALPPPLSPPPPAPYDVLVGGSGDDLLFGGNANDIIYDGSGNDTAYGGAGSDTMVGDGGIDLQEGDAGDDWIYLANGDGSTAYGGGGNDVLIATQGRVIEIGDDGNDTEWGASGNDYFYGGNGNDIMYGGDGVDVLIGGAGNDYFDGGTAVNYYFGGNGGGPGTGVGNDTFNISLGGIDVLQDWTEGLDHVVLNGSGFSSFSDVLSHSFQNGAYFIVQVDSGTVVWLNGATAASADPSDFTIVS